MTNLGFQENFTAHFEKRADEVTEGEIRGKHELRADEPEWLPIGGGNDEHPAPGDYLMTALVTCQISVLSQCLEKSRIENYHIEADATIDEIGQAEVPEEMPDNTTNRVEHIDVELTLEVPEEYASRAERCLEVYDAGCIVGQSYVAGIDYTPSVSLETAE